MCAFAGNVLEGTDATYVVDISSQKEILSGSCSQKEKMVFLYPSYIGEKSLSLSSLKCHPFN